MKETMVEAEVTFTCEYHGRFYIIRHVPARVCQETGEKCFSPDTVRRIQNLIWSGKKPDEVLEAAVYEFAGSL